MLPAFVIAQEVSMNELVALVNMDRFGIDTLMKKKRLSAHAKGRRLRKRGILL